MAQVMVIIIINKLTLHWSFEITVSIDLFIVTAHTMHLLSILFTDLWD